MNPAMTTRTEPAGVSGATEPSAGAARRRRAPDERPGQSVPRRRIDRRPLVLLAGLALLLAVMVAGVALGSVRVSAADVWTGILGERTGATGFIVWNLRVPRVLLATLVGMNLALAGAVLQSVTRNPLADPHLLGLSAGGALAAVLAFH